MRPILTTGLMLACVSMLGGCLSVDAGAGDPVRSTAQLRTDMPQVGLLTVLGDEAQVAAFSAQQQALAAPDGGISVPWAGGAAKGTVTPGPIHVVNAQVCRDVVHVAERDRERLRGRATLCRDPDGSWRALE